MKMDVPLNGALGRLLCKFVAIFAILLLIVWTLSQHQKSTSDVVELEGKLRFAQEQLSSLHAQIDVITRHKEKIESLLNEERQTFERTKNEYSERILHLETENGRYERELAKMNGMAGKGKAPNVEEIGAKNGSNALLEKVGQNDGGMEEQRQQPIEEPAEEKEEKGVKKEEELGEQKDEDPFEEREEGNGGGHHGIVGQIKPPNNQFANIVEEKKPTRKEPQPPNGGEKIGDDYIFRRPVPREDLVFHREEEMDQGKKEKWMNGSELLRKLTEKKEKKGKKEEEAEMQDRDFRE